MAGMNNSRASKRVSALLSHLQPRACSALPPQQQPQQAEKVAEVFLSAWSDYLDTRPAASDLKALAQVRSVSDALDVHRAMVASPQASRLGEHVGYKLGWKGVFPEQHALYGPVFGCGLLRSGDSVSLSRHKVFSAEAEFGFVLKRRLEPRTEAYSEAEVLAAVDHVELCIELCSCRQWATYNKLHYVADSLLAGCIVRGPSLGLPDPASLPRIAVKLVVAGVGTPAGTAENNPYGAPLASLTFLVNDLCVARRTAINEDMLIIAGHCCQAAFAGRPCPPHTSGSAPVLAWRAGDTIRAEFEGVGAVEAVLLD